MRRRRVPLPVVYSDVALRELDEIAAWNEQSYGRDHARSYLAFLERHIDALGETHANGRPVSTRSDLRYMQIPRGNRGHGHVAVYSVDEQAVNVLHVFHTARDWQTRLAEE